MKGDGRANENKGQIKDLNVNHLSETEKPLGLRIHVIFLTVSFRIVFPPSFVINLDFKHTLTRRESSVLITSVSIIGEILSLAISMRESWDYYCQIVSVPEIEEIASPYKIIRNGH